MQLNSASAWAAEASQGNSGGESAAAETSARERAKSLYEAGLAAYREGKHSDAIDKLLEADRVMPNAAFSYNIAVVYEAMGDQRSALRWLRSYLRQSKPGSDQSATVEKLRRFEAQLQARGLQQVSILTVPVGAMLKIDGVNLGLTPFTTELAPGSHVATVTLDGYQSAQQTFELRADRSIDVEITLKAANPEGAPVTAVSPEPPLPKEATGRPAIPEPKVPGTSAIPAAPAPRASNGTPVVRPWTWVSLSLGTALLGGALAFELKRQKDEDEARNAPQSTYLDHYDRMESSQTAARVFLAAGSLVLASGIGLLTFDLIRRGSSTATVGACPSGDFCVAWRGSF